MPSKDTSVETDYDQHLANRHEQAMRDTRVRIAKIEAARDLKIARSRDSEYQGYSTARIAICAVAAGLICLMLCITYDSTTPGDPVKIKDERERYELCMEVEEDQEKC